MRLPAELCNHSSLLNHGENMKLNERLRTMLTAIAQSPRRANYFTHGDRRSQIHPDILKTWLDQMCEAGYCFEAEQAYHITTLGRAKLDQKDLAGVRQYVIGRGTYRTGDGEHQPPFYRPGSDHSHIKSHGVRC